MNYCVNCNTTECACMTTTHPTQASVGEVKYPEQPDLRYHAEYRRGYAQALSDVQALNADVTASPLAAIEFVVEEWEGNGRANADAAMDRIADLLQEANHE